ncbi:MAG TPA: tripartite tricarboxylate transporter substrate binding protein, partial [Vicinamibacteria bacterium]
MRESEWRRRAAREGLRKLLAPLALGVVMSALPRLVYSSFPDKPIQLLVGQGAGGSTDTVTRTFAEFLGKHLGSPVIVRNMEGAGGRMMLRHVSSQASDGYSLCMVVTPSYINVQLLRSPDWDLNEFTYIQGVGGGDSNGLIVPYDSEIESFADLIELAKKGPLAVGSTAPGSNSWLLGVLLAAYAGDLRISPVPFGSGMEASLAIAGSHVPVGIVSTVNIPDLLKEKQVRAIAVSSSERLSYLPEVPTFVELGYPDIVTEANMYLAAP